MDDKIAKTNTFLKKTPFKSITILVLALSVIAGAVFLFNNSQKNNAKAGQLEPTGTIGSISPVTGVLGSSLSEITLYETTGVTFPAVGTLFLNGCNQEISGVIVGDSTTSTWTPDSAVAPYCSLAGVQATSTFSVFASANDAFNGTPIAYSLVLSNIEVSSEYAHINNVTTNETDYFVDVKFGTLDPNYFKIGFYYTESDENYILQDLNAIPQNQIFDIQYNSGIYNVPVVSRPQLGQKICATLLNSDNSMHFPESGSCRFLPIITPMAIVNSAITGAIGSPIADIAFTFDPSSIPQSLFTEGQNIRASFNFNGCSFENTISGIIYLNDLNLVHWSPEVQTLIPSCANAGAFSGGYLTSTESLFNGLSVEGDITLKSNTAQISNAFVPIDNDPSTDNLTVEFNKNIPVNSTIHFYFADLADSPLQDLDNLPVNQKYSGQSPLVIPYIYGSALSKICTIVVDESGSRLPNSGNCVSIAFLFPSTSGNALDTATLTNAGAVVDEEQPSTNTIRFDFTKNLSPGNTLHFYFANQSDSTPLQDLDNLPANQKYNGQSPYTIPFTYGTTSVKACVVVVEPSGNRLPNSGNCTSVGVVSPESVVVISNTNVGTGTCNSPVGNPFVSLNCTFPLTGGSSYQLPSSGIQAVVDNRSYDSSTPSNCNVSGTNLNCTNLRTEGVPASITYVKLYFGPNSSFEKASVTLLQPIPNATQNTGRTGKLYFIGLNNATPTFDMESGFNTSFLQTQKFKDGPVKLVYEDIKTNSGDSITTGACTFKLYRYGNAINTGNTLKTYTGAITNGKCEATVPVVDQTLNYYRIRVDATDSSTTNPKTAFNIDTLVLNVGASSPNGNPNIEL
jgi:hypothetical protein